MAKKALNKKVKKIQVVTKIIKKIEERAKENV